MSRVGVRVGPADAVWTWSAPTSKPSVRSTCHRQVESAPPDTMQVTAPPGGINPCAATKDPTRAVSDVPISHSL